MKQISLNFNIPLSIFKEGDQFIAYTPALDVSTCGKTYAEVQKRFHEAVEIFFEETSRKGTLNEVLEELGWEQINKEWSPPPVIAHKPERMQVTVPA
jgi:predicted RNase H-like HicB family nuclease